MRLKGKNFQPWKEFSINIEGLTVLVGPSNRGKSAIFRALKGVLRNDIPENFIRNKQDDPLEIELEVDGHTILVNRKRKGSTKYEMDGKKYSSLGGKVPDEVAKLRFGEVKIGEYVLDPIFAEQNKAQFLIDPDRWKANELNAILGAFSNTEKLDAGKKEANLRITQRKSEANTLATEIRAAEERSARLLEITGTASVIAEAVHTLEKGIRTDESLRGQLESVLYHQARLQPLHLILTSLTLPDLIEVEPLSDKVANLQIAVDAFITSRFLHKLELVLKEVSNTWAEVVVNFKQDRGLTELFGLLDKVGMNSVEYVDKLTNILEKVDAQFLEAKTLDSSIAYLVVAISSSQEYKRLTRSLAEYDTQLAAIEEEIETVRQEIATEAVKELCPRCGKPMEHICQ
jgi:energy-coupling factor transporter ATP-binding protein EcfA2